MIKLHTDTLNNKKIAYSSETVFLVQVGRNRKSSYVTKYKIKGNLGQAVMYYAGINIGNGYKKRLLMTGSNKPILDRQFS